MTHQDTLPAPEVTRRQWRYIMEPADYGIPPHCCGSAPQYSEYVDFLWCPTCEVEFVPDYWGLFDGPIGIGVCKMLGISFSRVNLITGEVVQFDDPRWDEAWP